MPTAMKQLSVVQFFTWLALFGMWIFFVPAVGKGIFGGMPLGLHDDAARRLVEKQPRWLAPAAALAKKYEAKKIELAKEAKAARPAKPWYGGAQQMFGLSPADPDAGERIDATILASRGAIRKARPGVGCAFRPTIWWRSDSHSCCWQ